MYVASYTRPSLEVDSGRGMTGVFLLVRGRQPQSGQRAKCNYDNRNTTWIVC